MTWWVPVLSFVGALLGAGAAGWVALRGQHQDARGGVDLARLPGDTEDGPDGEDPEP